MKYYAWLMGSVFTVTFIGGLNGVLIEPVVYEDSFGSAMIMVVAWPAALGTLLGQIVRASGIILI